MSSERAAPFASKPPEGWDGHVEVMRATRMFLLQKKGPTRFVVRGETSDRKFTVLVGSRARCSCGVPLCLHHLFIMLKVLKVPPSNPLAWQTSLIDSEVDSILDGGNFGSAKEGRHGGVDGGERAAGPGMPKPGQHRQFLRRGGGRTSAGGSSSLKEFEGGGVRGEGTEGGGTRRLDIVPGEVCPVCQEEMEEDGGGEGVPPVEAATTVAEGRLTYCRDGCGNNMHARCMLMYAEHRRSGGEKPCCPLCRVDWGLSAVRALREDAQSRAQDLDGGRLRRRRGGGGKGGAATAVVPVTCRSCSVKVQAVFFRCLVCTPAGSWDLCRRCYAVSGVQRSHHSGGSALGPCIPVGRNQHPFVQGEAAADPPGWKPAEPPDGGTRRAGRGGGGVAGGATPAAAGVLSLQGREITTADFELLLTLDASVVAPLHEHLLQTLPPYDGTEVDGRDGSFFSPAALLPRPSAGGERGHGSSGSGIDNDGGNRRFSEVLPPETPTLHSRSVGWATVATEAAAAAVSSPVSTAPTPSLRYLVAAAAVARDATGAAGAAEVQGDEATAERGNAEARANSGEDPTMPTTAVPSFPSNEVAPDSGSFPLVPVSCCCCSHIDSVGDNGQTAGNNGSNVSSRSAATRLMERQRSPSSSSSSPIPPSQAALRGLPCGHNAHEACLIPLILESVGRGDPSRCLCPLDSSPIFPALSRHRRRVRRPRPGSDDGVSAVATLTAASRDHRRGTRSASSVVPPTDSGGTDRHARAAAARELLRRNTAAGFGSGGIDAADALGIALFGSGLAQQLPPPQSTRRHATAATSAAGLHPRETGSTIRTASTRQHGSTSRRAGVVDGAKEGGNDGGGDGGGPTGCRNGGRHVGGGVGPRYGSFGGEPRVNPTALFVGRECVVDATGGGAAAVRAGRVEDGGGTAPRSRRHQRRGSASVVRGSTVAGRLARRSSSGSSRTTGRGRNNSEACVSAASGGDSADGLALTTLSFASFATRGERDAEDSRKATGHPPSEEGGDDEAGGPGSGRGREALAVVAVNPSLAVGLPTARSDPPGHPRSIDGMGLVTAGG